MSIYGFVAVQYFQVLLAWNESLVSVASAVAGGDADCADWLASDDNYADADLLL